MRTYELIFIVQPELEEEPLNALVDSVQQVIVDNGGEVQKVERLGRRKLAYAIKKRIEGHYVLVHASLELTAIRELARSLRLSEDVLRHMLVRLEETG